MIAVVVPTNRPDRIEEFFARWAGLFLKYRIDPIVVFDHEERPSIAHFIEGRPISSTFPDGLSIWDVVYNKNDGVRNLGFYYALCNYGKELEYILTLDDDVFPEDSFHDPIQGHIEALQSKVPISWFTTASYYMRGFPYEIRQEADVWVSHGVWNGVHDYDAPTQLVHGNRSAEFYKGPIPKGCLFPCCGMNLAFRAEALEWMYFAPMGKELGVHRFADIWMGVIMKKAMDLLNKAVVTGYSTVYHSRASNVFSNLEQESTGIRWNEEIWKSAPCKNEGIEGYRKVHQLKLLRWRELINKERAKWQEKS